MFRHFNIRNFEILKYRSFCITSFKISTPTPVGVQISEDVPVPGEVLVAEGIRVLDRKKLKIPVPTRKNVLPAHP